MKNIKYLNVSEEISNCIQHQANQLFKMYSLRIDIIKATPSEVIVSVDLSECDLERSKALKYAKEIFTTNLPDTTKVHARPKKIHTKKKTGIDAMNFGINASKKIVGSLINSTIEPYFTAEILEAPDNDTIEIEIFHNTYYMKIIEQNDNADIHKTKRRLKKAAFFTKAWFDRFGGEMGL